MPPTEMEEILAKLPLRVGLYVPDDVLQDWFPTRAASPPEQAAEYAASHECEFKHYPERREGVFWKWVPAI